MFALSESQVNAASGPPSGLAAYLTRLRSERASGFLPPHLQVERRASDEEARVLDMDRLQARLLAAADGGACHTWSVIGGSGSGKSSLVIELMVGLTERGVACARLDASTVLDRSGLPDDARSLLAYLRPADVDEALWRSRIKRGAAVLFIDGLDEIFCDQPELRLPFMSRLGHSEQRFSVVVTSWHAERDEVADADGLEQHRLRLPEMPDRDVRLHLEAQAIPASAAQAEISSAGLEAVASNPFLLSLLVMQFKHMEPRPLPRSRAGLLLRTLEDDRALAATGPDDGTRLDGLVAAGLLSLRCGDIRPEELSGLLASAWPDSPAMPPADALPRCFVRAAGGAPERYRFLHDSLVDFSLALAFRGHALPALAWALGGPENLCADWVGLQIDPEAAAERVVDEALRRDRADLMIDLVLANRGVLSDALQARCWRAAGRALVAGRRIRDRALRRLVALPDLMLREALRSGVLDAVEGEDVALYQAVRSELLQKTLTAARFQSLRERRSNVVEEDVARSPGMDPLAEVIQQLRQATGSYRRAAANALGHIGDQGAVPALAHVLEPGIESEPKVRGSATNALGQIGDRSAVPALTRVLEPGVEGEARVRASAATALGHIGDRSAVPALARVLQPGMENEARVRASVANALGFLGDVLAIPALSQLLSPGAENEARVRASAANALGRIGDPDAVCALTCVLDSRVEPDAKVRASAVNALGQIGDPRAVQALAAALEASMESDPFVRASAASALGQVGDRAAVLNLARVLEPGVENDAFVRGSAANALGQIGDPRAVQALAHVLSPGSDKDAVVRASAANALGRIADRAGTSALVRTLGPGGDDDAFVRGSAATALGQTGDRTVVPPLTRALDPAHEADALVRAAAATALGQVGDRVAVPTLAAVLEPGVERDASVRRAVANALGRIGDRRAIPALAQLLGPDTESDLDARESAVTALGRLARRPEPWMLELESMLVRRSGQRDEQRVRESVLRVLARYASDSRIRLWLRVFACRDPEPTLRRLAVQGLCANAGLDEATVRYLIDPACPRKDGRQRDPDPGVQATVGTTLLLSRPGEPVPQPWLALAAQMLAAAATRSSTIVEVLEALSAQDPEAETCSLRALEDALPREIPNPHLAREIRVYLQRAARRLEAEQSLRLLTTRPGAILTAYREGQG